MNKIDGRDYINASHILPSNYSEPDRLSLLPKLSFIAAQGPMEETTPHFLQMIHEQRIDIVVMLTQFQGKEGKDISTLYTLPYRIIGLRSKYSDIIL